MNKLISRFVLFSILGVSSCRHNSDHEIPKQVQVAELVEQEEFQRMPINDLNELLVRYTSIEQVDPALLPHVEAWESNRYVLCYLKETQIEDETHPKWSLILVPNQSLERAILLKFVGVVR